MAAIINLSSPQAAELLQRMLALGISKFDPDPLAAIAAAEAAREGKRA